MGPVPFDLSKYIDHTLLAPGAAPADVLRLCAEAKRFGFYAVCVNPVFAPLAAAALQKSPVRLAVVAGFPLGASATAVKVFEARQAARAGAREIDMVMNIGAAKAGDWAAVFKDIQKVRQAVRRTTLKVILETGLLTRREIVRAAQTAVRAGADFVKTSTGFGPRGASLEDIRILRRATGGRAKIKASGGIRTRRQALRFIRAGAARLGTSASIAIVSELPKRK